MRSLLVGLGLLSAASLRVCGSENSSSPQATASAQASASAVASGSAAVQVTLAKPRIGGFVTAVGPHSVELLLYRSGKVEAIVSNAAGEPMNAGVGLSVTATTQSHGKESIALAYSVPRARFEGQATAGVELASAPVELALSVDGKPFRAQLASVLAIHAPEFGGAMLVADEHSAEILLRTNGEILAFVRDSTDTMLSSQAGLGVTATVRTRAGAREAVALNFDAARKCFTGKLKAGVDLAPGPFELSIASRWGVVTGGLAQVALRADADIAPPVLGAEAKLATGAHADAEAKLGASAKVKVPDVKANLNAAAQKSASAKAAIQVEPPKVNVQKSASASASANAGKAGGNAKASAGFSIGFK